MIRQTIAALALGAVVVAAPMPLQAETTAVSRGESDVRGFLLTLLRAPESGRLEIAERELKAAGEGASFDERIMRVIATGAIARRVSSRQSIRRGYPGQMRDEIDALIKQQPKRAWVQTLDALWHLEVLRRAGGFGGAIIGARKSKGLAAAKRAMAAPGYDDGTALALAAGLAGHDPRQHKALIAKALTVATESKQADIRKAALKLEKLMGEDYGAAADYSRKLI